MNENQSRVKDTKEFKQDAVNLVIEQGYSANEVGRRLGINQSNVSRWVRESRGDQQDIVEGEILKKAAAFFAKESN